MGSFSNTPGQVTIVPVFWLPSGFSYTANYQTIIDQYVDDLAAASNTGLNVFSVYQEYYDSPSGTNRNLVYHVTHGTDIVDTQPFPTGVCPVTTTDSRGQATGLTTCISDGQLQAELSRLGVASSDRVVYQVLLPQHVETCQGNVAPWSACSAPVTYCGYHSGFNTSATTFVLYSNLPFPLLNYCADDGASGAQAPNGDAYADALLSIFSHEANEAITDSFGAWFDSNGYENGDECAYVYGLESGPAGAFYNQTINGHHYLTQTEFSNQSYFANSGDPVDNTHGTITAGCVQTRLPTSPSGVTATAGNTYATLTWTPALSAGSSPITGYRVTPSGGSPQTFNGSATSAVFTGLTNGTSYTFTVAAINAIGTGPDSVPSNTVTPATPAAGVYVPVTPFRILDTRQCAPCGAPIGPYSTPFDTGTIRQLQVTGGGGVIPSSGVTAVVLNVTATDTTQSGFFTLYPHGAGRPNSSNVNFVAGQTVPNLVQVAVGASGQVDLYNFYGNADMIIDVAGYFATGGGTNGLFNPLTPTRILDTRNCAPCGAPIGPYSTPFGVGQTRTLQIAGGALGGVPLGASGVVLNVTVTNPTNSGFLTLFPDGASKPNASNVNFVAGQTVPNRVYVKLGSNGYVDIYNFNSTTDVIIDVNGYFSNGSSTTSGYQYYSLPPARIIDTRQCPACGAPIGAYGTPFTGGQTRTAAVAGTGALLPASANAQAVVANATTTDTTQGGFYTLFPDGTTRPNASDVNWVTGETVPNLSVTKLGSNGQMDVYNYFGNADLIIDVNGYYGP